MHYFANCFLPHFIHVLPMALHSVTFCGQYCLSQWKHFLLGPHLFAVWFLFTSFGSALLFGFSILSDERCLIVPFLKAMANCIDSSTIRFGSVCSFCCTSSFAIFTMNRSFSKLLAIPQNVSSLNFAANLFRLFQNWRRVSPSFCFLAMYKLQSVQ